MPKDLSNVKEETSYNDEEINQDSLKVTEDMTSLRFMTEGVTVSSNPQERWQVKELYIWNVDELERALPRSIVVENLHPYTR